MLLDLTRYRRPVEHLSKTFDPGEVNVGDEFYRVVAPVVFDVDVHKEAVPKGTDRFRLVGTVRTELELVCSRCLEPYRMPVGADLDLRLLPEGSIPTQVEQEVAEVDLETTYYRDDQVDVNELLREQFYLALPMKPLCRDTCQGLCAVCGVNKNVAVCACAPVWEDPRLAPLKAFAQPARRGTEPSKGRPS
jgi:uncharacterized protein